MSEFRFNRVTGDWVIIATERARRPEDYIIRMNRRDMPPHIDTCPYCVGNEDQAETVFAEPAEGAWAVRLVKNKFPALVPGLNHEVSGGMMERTMTGIGYHEVLVGHRDHNCYLHDQSLDEARRARHSADGAFRKLCAVCGNISLSRLAYAASSLARFRESDRRRTYRSRDTHPAAASKDLFGLG